MTAFSEPTQSQLSLAYAPPSNKVRSTFHEMRNALSFAAGPQWPDRFGSSLRKWSQSNAIPRISTLSLFTGGGGLDIGFHDAGFQTSAMVEYDQRFVATLLANSCPGGRYEGIDIHPIDIKDYDPIPQSQVDFIIGGPPCQPFSAGGRRVGGAPGTADQRGRLFQHYVRLLCLLRPSAFLFENVYGITGAQGGEAWRDIVNSFRAAGYRIHHRILDAADYGVPQHRERVFIVGTQHREFLFPRPTHGPDSPAQEPYFGAAEAIEGVQVTLEERTRRIGGRYGDLLDAIPPGLNYSFYTSRMGNPKPLFAWRSKFSDFLYKADPETPVRTIKALGGQFTGPFHWSNRPFGIAELKALQTFPADYVFGGTRQAILQQIGNSVPPQMARILAIAVLQQLFGVQLPFDLPLLSHTEKLGFRTRKRALTATYAEKAAPATTAVAESRAAVSESIPASRTYTATLREGFSWNHLPADAGRFLVRAAFTARSCRISLRDRQSRGNGSFTLRVEPATLPEWALPASEVLIAVQSTSPQAHTAAWKAFEDELIFRDIKADLVQLSGYYQYTPAITARMSLKGWAVVPLRWRVLQLVTQGTGTRATYPAAELALLWGVRTSQVHTLALFLKSLGYEVRNSQTNLHVPEGHYVIPYVFPTLNPMSVQLRKTLE